VFAGKGKHPYKSIVFAEDGREERWCHPSRETRRDGWGTRR
jgi:hypothetical protein